MFTLITLWFIGNLYVFAVDADLKIFKKVNIFIIMIIKFL